MEEDVQEITFDLTNVHFDYGINMVSNTLHLCGEIDLEQLYSLINRVDYMLTLNQEQRDINLIVSSYGGDSYAVMGMIDFIHSLPVKVNSYGIGATMSSGALLVSCCTGERRLTKNSTFLIHEGTANLTGDIRNIQLGAEQLKVLNDNMYQILSEHSNKSVDFWKGFGNDDTWFTAEECLEHGLIDKIGGIYD